MIASRWLQLGAGIAALVAVANLQYGWTLFVDPIDHAHHWERARIQLAFTLFVLAETWLVPFEAYLVDHIGPRIVVAAGGALVAVAWTINGLADSLPMLYLGNTLGGLATGCVYGTAMGSALKWFPDRRGLAAGLTAAAFGAGAALTVLPIERLIHGSGYRTAFVTFGLAQGLVVLVAAAVLRAPRPGEIPPVDKPLVPQSGRDFTPRETLRAPAFWLLYAMFTMVATGGLMATAQLGPISDDFNVAERPVSLLGLTLPALTFALSLDRVLNGVSRPLFGGLSDHLGRERVMFLAFGLEGVAILVLVHLAHDPLLFVVLSGLAFFAWGEIFSLFPALSGDMFGRRFATTNYSLLYTAKGLAALMVPVGTLVSTAAGSWKPIFFAATALDWSAALLALLVVRPLRAQRPERR
jgi:OFA family oxalate/formate antiporter-like MFS transporter